MNVKKMSIDDAELEEARGKAEEGQAYILVIENNSARLFVADEVFGYLSWTAILGPEPERIDLRYGSDLQTGFHTFDAVDLRPWYRAPDGELYTSALEGKVFINVTGPGSGTEFEHTGVLLNVRFEKSDGSPIVLNGTFNNSFT
ncbi:hypothetical protein [Pseudomonas proteolytica]|uniref:Uncharacterized protein n=1 Tax=Pseudomonas proteolytica TaxID=219574 RepID=A0AAW5ACJ7_9PSED|nr:hypothetical protein [Pseudomonas proteolytica]KAA8699706.1 hypothetical protein F4W61_20555 [Pseudomonas proteolytica]MCF5060425.1 hypothetical protein [Pseudomonas proteolytica]MCF5103038.1 hypothetical protein [Pseudomonas proteolytica]TWR85646.1 hypothetical protein FIV38_03810 [Pseudomonas proteolytica]SEC76593.1 hypothetical protein SAMN04490200_0454 [Pseudomonas proteolytica]